MTAEKKDRINPYISLIFEDHRSGKLFQLEAPQGLFVEQFLDPFDEETGAVKLHDIKDKVIVKIAWHLKDHWKWESIYGY